MYCYKVVRAADFKGGTRLSEKGYVRPNREGDQEGHSRVASSRVSLN
jgi:hypothetical protein